MSRRNLLSASYDGGGIENILVLKFFQSEGDYVDGVRVGDVYYYNVYSTFPIQSDITIKDAKYPNDPRFTHIMKSSYTSYYICLGSKLTSPDDVIISPQKDNTYIYKVEIQN